MIENKMTDLMAYFSTEERPVKVAEFNAFWKSCTDADKAYFKAVDLKTGLLPA